MALPQTIAAPARKILQAPDQHQSYDRLKFEPSRRTCMSEQRTRLQALLTSGELGKRKPTKLLHWETRQTPLKPPFCMSYSCSGFVKMCAWSDSCSLEALCGMVDKTVEVRSGVFVLQPSAVHLTSGSSATCGPHGPGPISELCLKVDQLTRDCPCDILTVHEPLVYALTSSSTAH